MFENSCVTKGKNKNILTIIAPRILKDQKYRNAVKI